MKTIWLDAQLPPVLGKWVQEHFGIACKPVRDMGLLDVPDHIIFQKAKEADVVVITKDKDFVELLRRFHAPPRVVWLTCGNTSRDKLKEIFDAYLLAALAMLESENELVEIN